MCLLECGGEETIAFAELDGAALVGKVLAHLFEEERIGRRRRFSISTSTSAGCGAAALVTDERVHEIEEHVVVHVAADVAVHAAVVVLDELVDEVLVELGVLVAHVRYVLQDRLVVDLHVTVCFFFQN